MFTEAPLFSCEESQRLGPFGRQVPPSSSFKEGPPSLAMPMPNPYGWMETDLFNERAMPQRQKTMIGFVDETMQRLGWRGVVIPVSGFGEQVQGTERDKRYDKYTWMNDAEDGLFEPYRVTACGH